MKNNIINKLKLTIISSGLLFPIFSQAQLGGTEKFFERASRIVSDIIVPLVFVLALLFFFWGVAKYILSAGTEKEEGRKIMVWGVVALFVMSSVWGLVAFIRSELGGGQLYETDIKIPTITR